MKRWLFLGSTLLLGGGCADSLVDAVEYGAVEVETVRRSGDPIAGASAFLYNGTLIMGQGKTDEAGHFRFEFVPPNVLGPYGVYAEPPTGYLRFEEIAAGSSTAFVDGIFLEEGGEGKATFTYLKEGPGRVSVLVNRQDGDAVEDTEVFLYGPDGDLAQATVGASGTVAFDAVPFGNHGVRVVPPPGYFYDPEVGIFRDEILIDEGWEEAVSFSLQQCLWTIRAHVEDDDGVPVPGIGVTVYSAEAIEGTQATAEDGTTTFHGVGCQEYGVVLVPLLGWSWEEGRGTSYFDGIRTMPGDELDFTFTVERLSALIRVRVVDQSGAPVPNAGLELYNSQGPWATGVTGADGVFLFVDVPVGQEYGVKVLPPEGFSVQEGRGSSWFDGIQLLENEETVIDFVLTKQ